MKESKNWKIWTMDCVNWEIWTVDYVYCKIWPADYINSKIWPAEGVKWKIRNVDNANCHENGSSGCDNGHIPWTASVTTPAPGIKAQPRDSSVNPAPDHFQTQGLRTMDCFGARVQADQA